MSQATQCRRQRSIFGDGIIEHHTGDIGLMSHFDTCILIWGTGLVLSQINLNSPFVVEWELCLVGSVGW